MKNTASISALIIAFSAIAGLAVLSTACGDDDTTNGGSSSGSTSGSTSGTTSSGGTSSGSTSSGGTSSGGTETGAQAYAKATCTHIMTCTPNGFAAQYASVDACATGTTTGTGTAVTYPGLTQQTDAELQACAAKLATQDCTLTSPPAECVPKAGTLADGTKCNIATQCSGGLCGSRGSDGCGTCAKTKAKDETCDPAKGECAAGLYCKTDKCAELIAKDGACTLAESAFCVDGTVCTATATDAGKCVAKAKIGEACEATFSASTCYTGLFCNADKKCAEPTYGAVDAECNGTDKLCKASTCDTTAKKCVAYVAEGGDCDPTFVDAAKRCDPTKDACDATSKKCEAPKASTATVCQ
jgi:hypothetical protein